MNSAAKETIYNSRNQEENFASISVPSHDNKPNVIVTGDGPQLEELKNNLLQSNIKVEHFENFNDLVYTADTGTIAAIFVDTEIHTNLCSRITNFKNKIPFKTLPVFAVVPKTIANKKIRRLYKAGANDVFQWVTESANLVNLIIEHRTQINSSNSYKGKGLTKQDRQLSNAIMTRLQVLSSCGPKIKVSVREGKATVMGQMQSFRTKRKIEALVAATPGVSDTTIKNVAVPATDIIDVDLATRVHKQLAEDTIIREGAISVSSENATVTLAGAVGSKFEMKRVLETARKVKGVLNIRNLLSISETQAKTDNSLAKKVHNLISGFFFKSKVRVSVIKDTVFLAGRVDLVRKRQLVEDVVKNQFRPVHRVINNIYST